jgi:hypothetical protein
MGTPFAALGKPCINGAASWFGQAVNARVAGLAVTVNKSDPFAGQVFFTQPTAAKLCYQVRPVRASSYAVDILTAARSAQQSVNHAQVTRVVSSGKLCLSDLL